MRLKLDFNFISARMNGSHWVVPIGRLKADGGKMIFEISIKVVSEPITIAADADWVKTKEDACSYLDKDYFGTGGSVVRVASDFLEEFSKSPFSTSELDEEDFSFWQDEDGFEFVSLDDEESWKELTFQCRSGFTLNVDATSEAEAMELCQEALRPYLELEYVASGEVLEIQNIEVHNIENLG